MLYLLSEADHTLSCSSELNYQKKTGHLISLEQNEQPEHKKEVFHKSLISFKFYLMSSVACVLNKCHTVVSKSSNIKKSYGHKVEKNVAT